MSTRTGTRINFRTDTATKEAATRILDTLGLDMTTALNLFLRQTIHNHALPFTPSAATTDTEARRQAVGHEGRTFHDTDELRRFYGD